MINFTRDGYFSAIKTVALSSFPFLISVLFVGFDGLTLVVPTILVALSFCAVITLVIAFILATFIPESILEYFWFKSSVTALGFILGCAFFHYNNAYYGMQRSAFHVATGYRPFLEINVIRFRENSWTDYSFEMNYQADQDFNKKIIALGQYQKDIERKDSACYFKPKFTYVNTICFDSSLRFGSITYSVD